MKKVNKIFSIMITTILTVVSLWQIVPNDIFLKRSLNKILEPMISNEMVCTFIGIVLVFLGCFSVIAMICELKDVEKEHTFCIGSYRFRRFFSKWYLQPGTLSIICDNLQGWLVSKDKEDILNALRKKSKNGELHLILGKEIPINIVNELKDLGAVIHHAPREIISNYSFSCISVMGNNAAVIIRNKQKDEKI